MPYNLLSGAPNGDGKWRIAQMPTADGSETNSENGGSSLVIVKSDDKAKVAAGEPLETVKGAELSGKDNILFIRNSVSGRIEARYRKTGIELNEKLHKN